MDFILTCLYWNIIEREYSEWVEKEEYGKEDDEETNNAYIVSE